MRKSIIFSLLAFSTVLLTSAVSASPPITPKEETIKKLPVCKFVISPVIEVYAITPVVMDYVSVTVPVTVIQVLTFATITDTSPGLILVPIKAPPKVCWASTNYSLGSIYCRILKSEIMLCKSDQKVKRNNSFNYSGFTSRC